MKQLITSKTFQYLKGYRVNLAILRIKSQKDSYLPLKR
jgi:hypothetical protein